MKVLVYILVLMALGYLPLRRWAKPELRRQLGWLPFGLTAAVYVVMVLTPYPPLVLLACFMVPTIRPGRRIDVACRYMLLMPLMPELTVTVLAGGHVLIQLTPVAALSLGALAASTVATNRPSREPVTGFRAEHCVALILLVIFGIGGPRFSDPSLLVRSVINNGVQLLVPLFLLLRTVRDRDELALVFACLGSATVVLAFPALYEHHAGWCLFDAMSQRLSGADYIARSSYLRGGTLRAAVTMSTAIELSLFMAIGLFAIFASARFFRKPRQVYLLMALIALGLLAAQSRGAFVAIAVGLVVLMSAEGRWVRSSLVVAAAAGLYGMLLLAADSSYRVAAFLGQNNGFGRYRDYRSALLERGLQEGRQHPWLGTSLADVSYRLRDITQGEHIIDFVNTYLNIYLISGLAGLAALILGLVAVYAGLLHRRGRALRRSVEIPRAFCLLALTILLASLVTTSFYGRIPSLAALLLAAARLCRWTDGRVPQPAAAPVERHRPGVPVMLAAG